MDGDFNNLLMVGMNVNSLDVDNSKISITFNQNHLNYIRGIIGNLNNLDGIKLMISSNSELSRLLIDSKETNISLNSLISYIDNLTLAIKDGSIDNFRLDDNMEAMYNLIGDFIKEGKELNVGFGNSSNGKCYVISSKNNPNIINILNSYGLSPDSNGKYVIEDSGLVYELFNKMNTFNNVDNLDNRNNKDLGGNDIMPGESKVDFFEKTITDANGNNVKVRLSIIQQNSDDSQYERLVNVTYIDKNNGIVTSNEVYGYKEAYQFDSDVLPNIIDGFKKNAALSGRGVAVSDDGNNRCFLTSGEDGNEIYLEGYNINETRSLLDMNRENKLFNDGINTDEIVAMDRFNVEGNSGVTFEERVTDSNFDDYEDTQEYDLENSNTLNNNKTMVKKLGTHPSMNNAANVTMDALLVTVCLLIDVIAIAVGMFLLVR